MANSMFVELQPWTTIGVETSKAVEQPRGGWVDARGYDEVLLSVEISKITGANGKLRVETSLVDDRRAMVLMKDADDEDTDFEDAREPDGAMVIVRSDSVSPLRRWVRWVAQAGGGDLDITFRITALFRSSR